MGGFEIRLCAALILGAGAGLTYDALRPLRRRARAAPAAMLDLLFCVLTGAGLFLYAMGAENGTLGLWELAAALAGLLMYVHLVGERMYLVFKRGLDRLDRVRCFLLDIIKKTAVLTKKFFQKVRECFIIKK